MSTQVQDVRSAITRNIAVLMDTLCANCPFCLARTRIIFAEDTYWSVRSCRHYLYVKDGAIWFGDLKKDETENKT